MGAGAEGAPLRPRLLWEVDRDEGMYFCWLVVMIWYNIDDDDDDDEDDDDDDDVYDDFLFPHNCLKFYPTDSHGLLQGCWD